MTDLPHNIRAGEIIAWRAWRYYPSSGILTSIHASSRWLPQATFTATDGGYYQEWDSSSSRPPPLMPSTSRDGGIYAFKYRFMTIFSFADMGSEDYPVVIGKVALWGDVVEHRSGYRAQFAYPEKFTSIWGETWRNRGKTKKMLVDIREKYLGQ